MTEPLTPDLVAALTTAIRMHAYHVRPGEDGRAAILCTCGVLLGGTFNGWLNGAPVPPTYAVHVAEAARAALTAATEPPDPSGLRALSEAATPGAWSSDAWYVVGGVPGRRWRPGGEVIGRMGMTVGGHPDDTREQQSANAAFVAAAVNYLRSLLAKEADRG